MGSFNLEDQSRSDITTETSAKVSREIEFNL